jgi:hypothetical protein
MGYKNKVSEKGYDFAVTGYFLIFKIRGAECKHDKPPYHYRGGYMDYKVKKMIPENFQTIK